MSYRDASQQDGKMIMHLIGMCLNGMICFFFAMGCFAFSASSDCQQNVKTSDHFHSVIYRKMHRYEYNDLIEATWFDLHEYLRLMFVSH